MTPKLKKARKNILKAARELDKISKCSQAKQRIMTLAVRAWLREFYRY